MKTAILEGADLAKLSYASGGKDGEGSKNGRELKSYIISLLTPTESLIVRLG